MPHQCTKCGQIYADASEEILKGCSCGGKFFYYIRESFFEEPKKTYDEKMFDSLPENIQEKITQLNRADKNQIEKDIRDISGLNDEPEKPVILDLESIKVISPGKFELDIVNLFNKRRPLIYKLEEGKYIIDLASSFKADTDEVNKKIRDPNA